MFMKALLFDQLASAWTGEWARLYGMWTGAVIWMVFPASPGQCCTVGSEGPNQEIVEW